VISERFASAATQTKKEPQGIRFPSPSETTIFVIDDEPPIVEALRFFLEGRGFQVEGFEDPNKAVERIREEPPYLVITDRNMPGLGGFDLARRALEEDPDIGVIILTGAKEAELAIEAFHLGVMDYLLKPLDLKAIEDSVRKALIRRTQNIFHRATEARMRASGCVVGGSDGRSPVRPGQNPGTAESALPGAQPGGGRARRGNRPGARAFFE
jgi:DNA-binding NtrC family response regulator